MVSKSSLTRVLLIAGNFIFCVALIVTGLQVAGYLINDVLHIEGWARTALQFAVVIFIFYPMKFVYDTVQDRISQNT